MSDIPDDPTVTPGRYIDPNSGAAPQPGGKASVVTVPDDYEEPEVGEYRDPTLDAISQTQAIDTTNQPGNPDASYEVPMAEDDAELLDDPNGGGSEQGQAPQDSEPDQANSRAPKRDTKSDLGSDVEGTEEPAGNASQEEWRDYAVNVKGADADEASEMGRNELRDMYGSK